MLWLIQRQLKSKNTASRRKALEGLCEAPQPRALGALSQALNDEDAEVRRLAATALGKLEIEERIEPLLTAARDRDADVQKAAIIGLKRTSDERVSAALVPLPGVAATLIFVLTRFWRKAQKSRLRHAVEKGFAPLTVGLILATSLVMSRAADHDWRAYLLTGVCTLIFVFTKTNPLIMVGGAAFIGYLGVV